MESWSPIIISLAVVIFVMGILFVALGWRKEPLVKDVNGSSHDDSCSEDPYKADDHWDKNSTSR